jgi:hypothetical protein
MKAVVTSKSMLVDFADDTAELWLRIEGKRYLALTGKKAKAIIMGLREVLGKCKRIILDGFKISYIDGNVNYALKIQEYLLANKFVSQTGFVNFLTAA